MLISIAYYTPFFYNFNHFILFLYFFIFPLHPIYSFPSLPTCRQPLPPDTSMAPQPSGAHPSLALRGSDLPTGLIGEVSGTLGGCLDFRAGDFCLLIRVRQRLNNFLSTVCVGENFGTYLWIFLRHAPRRFYGARSRLCRSSSRKPNRVHYFPWRRA